MANVPPEALVIRFRPTNPESVLRWVEKEFRRTGRGRLSVFADVSASGEGEDVLRARLLKAAELSGIPPASNRKYFVCVRAEELLARGFTFWKDGDEDEADEHYSVDLGDSPTIEDVQRFLEAFSVTEERPS